MTIEDLREQLHNLNILIKHSERAVKSSLIEKRKVILAELHKRGYTHGTV